MQRIPAARAWQALAEHRAVLGKRTLNELFADESDRAQRYAIETGSLYLDFSKNHLTATTVELLMQLADASGLTESRRQLFSGDKINPSEGRAALHTALRCGKTDTNTPAEIADAVHGELERMTALHGALTQGRLIGFNNDPVDTVVNIGIGGSDLGPRLLTRALARPNCGLQVHFAANLDPADLDQVLNDCQPATTLFVIASKSFDTLETRANYLAARRWLHAAGCSELNLPRHFLAATANVDAALAAGIERDRVFRFWDWVGGRYSVWSAAGLSGFLAIGPECFQQFLAGARQIDEHFYNSEWSQNLPVMLALIGIWYINFFDCSSHAIIPYDQRLALLPDYLCQLVMESNGKSTSMDGQAIDWHTAPVTWGGVGSNVQHSFLQALHQGTQTVPVDFLVPVPNTSNHSNDQRERDLFLSCLAQSRALMCGSQQPQPHRCYPGNRPSNTLLYDSLDAKTLGALLAVYEHKTFVQAQLWRINAFDQWGVELGKTMTREMACALDKNLPPPSLDASTASLLARYRRD